MASSASWPQTLLEGLQLRMGGELMMLLRCLVQARDAFQKFVLAWKSARGIIPLDGRPTQHKSQFHRLY